MTPETLKKLALCQTIARDNLSYYGSIFDTIREGADRDMVGRAMAQKQDFISAVEVILNKCRAGSGKDLELLAANDSGAPSVDAAEELRQLEHEAMFRDALASCLEKSQDDALSELLSHHIEAAEIAVSAIKSTSLNL